MGRYIHVAGINWGPCVLKHKYHRHWNHGRPRVGFGDILGVPSIEPLLGARSGRRALSPPPPPETKTRPPQHYSDALTVEESTDGDHYGTVSASSAFTNCFHGPFISESFGVRCNPQGHTCACGTVLILSLQSLATVCSTTCNS